MIAQISSPIRALILLFTLIGGLYIFHPHAPSRSSFPFTNKPPKNAPAKDNTQNAIPSKAPHNALLPASNSVIHSTPGIGKAHVPGDITDDPDEGGPRLRQATMIYETERFNEIYERAVDTHIKHGERWGVPTNILRHDIIEAGFFNKPAFILGLIIQEMNKPYGKRAGWVVWFDADTIILNHAVPWTLFLPPSDFDDIHILATQDMHGFNAGMSIFRVSPWSVQVLSETLALRQLRPEIHFDFFDQGALKWVMEKEGYAEHVLYQPHSWWNSFGLAREPYDTDAFMLHFAGVDCCGQPESKGTVMGRWLDIVENRPQEYAVELEETKLPKEVEDYWALLKKAKKLLMTVDISEKKSGELENARTMLFDRYSRHADNATDVSMAIKNMEDVMAKVGVEPAVVQEVAEAVKQETALKIKLNNAPGKDEQEAQAKKEGESAKKEGESAKKEEKPTKKEEKPTKNEEEGTKEEASAKEAVGAKKEAAQAEMEAASAKKEPAPPAKNSN